MKKHLLFIFAAWLPMLASAKVEIDGIWYNLYSDESKAEVTFNQHPQQGNLRGCGL